jgi:hypothetical protein
VGQGNIEVGGERGGIGWGAIRVRGARGDASCRIVSHRLLLVEVPESGSRRGRGVSGVWRCARGEWKSRAKFGISGGKREILGFGRGAWGCP